MFFRSLFYERNVLMQLERLQQLPAEDQAEIAKRVGTFVELAKTVSDEELPSFAKAAQEETQHAVELGAKSELDPLWAAPAISEAWYNAKLGLVTGNLKRHSAIEIIVAIETFTVRLASHGLGLMTH